MLRTRRIDRSHASATLVNTQNELAFRKRRVIAAARNPAENRSLISFTIWSSVVYAAIMVQALYDSREHGHLVGDVPALLLVAGVLWFLSPTNKIASRAAEGSNNYWSIPRFPYWHIADIDADDEHVRLWG